MNTILFLSKYQDIAPINELLLLLSKVTASNTSNLLLQDNLSLTPSQIDIFDKYINDLSSGIPLPYILGEWGFYGLLFAITPDVLIPRPETEQIIDLCLANFILETENLKILDVGTGSGIIPITLATKYPNSKCIAVDISEKAVVLANQNAVRHKVNNRVNIIYSDLLPDDLQDCHFSIITANLPYIPYKSAVSLDVYSHEPALALVGGEIGDEIIKKFLNQLLELSISFDLLLIEIEYRQGLELLKFSKGLFPSKKVVLHRDLSGLDRIIEIQ